MIAIAKRNRSRKSVPAWHNLFAAMLPRIVAYARVAFRDLSPAAKADAIQEVVANAFVAYARLAELGKTSIAWPTPLAMYATWQYRVGHRVGNRLAELAVSGAASGGSRYTPQFLISIIENLQQTSPSQQNE